MPGGRSRNYIGEIREEYQANGEARKKPGGRPGGTKRHEVNEADVKAEPIKLRVYGLEDALFRLSRTAAKLAVATELIVAILDINEDLQAALMTARVEAGLTAREE